MLHLETSAACKHTKQNVSFFNMNSQSIVLEALDLFSLPYGNLTLNYENMFPLFAARQFLQINKP